jgi:hypothetical protein
LHPTLMRLKRYEQDLREFEKRYGMESATFYRRFQAGELGDAMDFFEWAGLYALYQDIIEKIRRLKGSFGHEPYCLSVSKTEQADDGGY